MLLTILKALADPSRLRIVGVLLHGPFTVQELTTILGVGQSRISWHLKILAEAGAVGIKRQGTWHYYQLALGESIFKEILPILERDFASSATYKEDCQVVAAIFEERKTRTKTFFDTVACQWDTLAATLLPVPRYEQALLDEVPACQRLAEVGIGTGSLLLSLEKKANETIGVDHSSAMLGEARKKVQHAGYTDVHFRLGDMHHLPFPDGYLDGVVLNMVLHHAVDPRVVLREMRRVLRPDGALVVAELQTHEQEAARERLADQWLGFDAEELSEWCVAAGFASCTCKPIAPEMSGQTAVQIVRAAV